MNIYGRVREERLSEAVERVGRVILKEKCVPSVYRLAVGRRTRNRNPCRIKELRFRQHGGGSRIRTYEG